MSRMERKRNGKLQRRSKLLIKSSRRMMNVRRRRGEKWRRNCRRSWQRKRLERPRRQLDPVCEYYEYQE